MANGCALPPIPARSRNSVRNHTSRSWPVYANSGKRTSRSSTWRTDFKDFPRGRYGWWVSPDRCRKQITLKTPIDRSMSRVSLSLPPHSALSFNGSAGVPFVNRRPGGCPPDYLSVRGWGVRTHLRLSRKWTRGSRIRDGQRQQV
jgi:hypothetical protein